MADPTELEELAAIFREHALLAETEPEELARIVLAAGFCRKPF